MRRKIEAQFELNLARVRGLVLSYQQLAGSGQGRATVGHTDVLRAAVVLLHATMEDLLRNVTLWKLPKAVAGAFKDVPFPDGAAVKCTLEDLAKYRGQSISIDDLFDGAIDQLLDRATYNNSGDVAAALQRVGILPSPILAKFGAQLNSITSRRHLIVHRLDVNPLAGQGQHAAHSLSHSTVTAWIGGIENFGRAVLDAS